MYSSRTNTHLSTSGGSNKKNTMESSRVPVASPPGQNVAFAVNYSLPSVDQFVAPAERAKTSGKGGHGGEAQSAPSTPATPQDAPPFSPKRTQLVEKDMNRAKSVTIVEDPSTINITPTTPTTTKRSSRRDRKPKEKSLSKHRVRYDMNHVPVVQRHDRFVAHHRSQDGATAAAIHHKHKQRALPPRRASARTAKDSTAEEKVKDDTCHKCKGEELPAPFVADSSVVWIPTKRTEWEDCLSEMTAVCTSAALRRHAASKGSSSSKPFFAPLSQAYIRDRIDIDDPLEGYQIRHKHGGWLQGFILWTNFTTWTHYFKWDSLHAMSGIPSSRKVDKHRHIDEDGSLATELEAQPRSGDPLATGVVFPTIAEISLLGGMGCGEYLLRMALDDIKSRGQYKYVVMQATDASRTFYERFGFVRVGAVCRYGNHGTDKSGCALSKGNEPQTATETDIVGYRHWTYANERNLDTYGGPSYMMALRLPSDGVSVAPPECAMCASEVTKPTVIEQLKAVAVEAKPKIAQLGAAPTPYKKGSWTPSPKPNPTSSKPAPAPAPKLSTLGSTLPAYPPGVRRRGRPPKYWSDMRRFQTPQQVGGKKRGPRAKSPPVTHQHQPVAVAAKPGPRTTKSSQQPAVKRGPGRPRKNPLPEQPAMTVRGPGRPRKTPLPLRNGNLLSPRSSSVKPSPVRPPSSSSSKRPSSPPSYNEPNAKRRRTSTEDVSGLDVQREVLMAPPPEGEKLSFSQKQYQSIWLAVPPTKTASAGRRPPREREAYMGYPSFFRKKRKRSEPEEGNHADTPPPAPKVKKAKVVSPRRSSRLSNPTSSASTKSVG